jgi:hypothetical protein
MNFFFLSIERHHLIFMNFFITAFIFALLPPVLVEDGKNAHLRELDGAKERLSLYRANVLDYDSLRAAFSSCDGDTHIY